MTNFTIETLIGGLGLPARRQLIEIGAFCNHRLELRRIPSFCTRHVQCSERADMNAKAEALKKRTFAFALTIIAFCRVLRKTWEGRELSDQLFRCGTRIGANYRAACRARSHADFVNKMGLVVEEADEAVDWLELIQVSGACPAPALQALRLEAGELCAIFTQSHITASPNAASRGPIKPIHQ